MHTSGILLLTWASDEIFKLHRSRSPRVPRVQARARLRWHLASRPHPLPRYMPHDPHDSICSIVLQNRQCADWYGLVCLYLSASNIKKICGDQLQDHASLQQVIATRAKVRAHPTNCHRHTQDEDLPNARWEAECMQPGPADQDLNRVMHHLAFAWAARHEAWQAALDPKLLYKGPRLQVHHLTWCTMESDSHACIHGRRPP